MSKKKIIEKYKDKILGALYIYKYGVQEFLDKKKLVDFLTNVADREAVLTKSGYDFLKEYYGFEEVASVMDANTKEELLAIKNSSDPKMQHLLEIVDEALEKRDKETAKPAEEINNDYSWSYDEHSAIQWLKSIDPEHLTDIKEH